MKALLLALTLISALIVLALAPSAQASVSCRPPRGPGDNLVHSSNLRATGVSCAVARQVVLASTRRPGQYFYVAGYRWSCVSTAFPGSHEHCRSGHGKTVSIIWGD
jgi:hypothetical protein